MQVIKHGGIHQILSGNQSQDPAEAAADEHAVGDALECLVHIVQGNQEGHAVALQSGALPAVAHALKVTLPGSYNSVPA